MAVANRVTGKDLYVSFGGVAVTADYREFSVEPTIDTVDKTAGAETDKSYIGTLKDATASLTYAYAGSAGTAISTKFQVGTEGALLWGPQGTATGQPKGGWQNAIVTGHSKPHTYNDLIVRTVTFQKSGTASFSDEIDVW